jgi:acetyl-CoA acetyltransferase
MRLDEIKDLLGKPTPSAEQIMKKHGISREQIDAQLKKGHKVESEHTDNKRLQDEIARDHLNEFPDYYDRLEKVEKK